MSQRSMVPVVVIGALVLLAGAGLWWMISSDDGAEAESTAQRTEREPEPTPTVRVDPSPSVTPTLPGEAAPRPEAGEVKEYVVGDRRVRDHRTGDRAPIDIPPAVHPAEARRITSGLTHEIGQKIKVMVKECAATLPAGAKTAASRLEGKIVISIKSKQVTVKEAVVQLREVSDASVDAVKKCIEEKALTVQHEAEETDLESYDINLSYAL